MANANHTGCFIDAILLSIGRAILRKQQREERSINNTEAYGYALALQGRFNFVRHEDNDIFCNEVVRSFRYVESRELSYISKKAYAFFRASEYMGSSILDESLQQDLTQLGYT